MGYYVKFIVAETPDEIHVRVYKQGTSDDDYHEVYLKDGQDPSCTCRIPLVDRKLCLHCACACASTRPPRSLYKYVFVEDTADRWREQYDKAGHFVMPKVAHAATCELSALEKPVIVPYNRGRPPTKRFPDPRDLAARAWAREENRKFREAALDTMSA